jgi:RHS repeat-associated protein
VDNFTLLGSYTISGFSLGTWYTLGLRANGSSISVEVNGNTVIGPVTNTAFTSGNTGVWSYAPNGAGRHRFDNFTITVPSASLRTWLGGGMYRKVKVLAMTDARRRAAVTAPPPNTTYRVYYYAGGKPIAMRVMPPTDATGTLYYLHSDHLGSTSVTTCGNTACGTVGSVFSRQRYYPYGEIRPGGTGTTPTTIGYTGQRREEAGLGSLMYYRARFYSPLLQRFLSADSIVPAPGYPQALNRYAYVYNSPLKYVDDSGNIPIIALLILGALKLIDYGWTAYDIAESTNTLNNPNALLEDKVLAGVNIALAVASEAGEPDDASPISLPADDVARKIALYGFEQTIKKQGLNTALRELGSAGVRQLFDLGAFKGIRSFRDWDGILQGVRESAGLEVHHLIEKRFAEGLGLNADDFASIVLTEAQHQVLTNRWRERISYGSKATLDEIWEAAQYVYRDHPELLDAVRKSLGIP